MEEFDFDEPDAMDKVHSDIEDEMIAKITGGSMDEKNKLQVLVDKSGLDSTKANILLENFQDAFKKAAEWELQAKAIVVTDASQEPEMALARTLRLEIKSVRTDVERTRKSMKEQALREGKAIDGIANVLKALMEPLESYLKTQEKFVEIQEEKAEAERRALADKLLEEKIEADRIAQEEAARIEREKERAAMLEAQEQAAIAQEKLMAERKAAAELIEKERAEAAEREKAQKAAMTAELEKSLAIAAEKAAEAKKEFEAKLEDERCAREDRAKELAAANRGRLFKKENIIVIQCPNCGSDFEYEVEA